MKADFFVKNPAPACRKCETIFSFVEETSVSKVSIVPKTLDEKKKSKLNSEDRMKDRPTEDRIDNNI